MPYIEYLMIIVCSNPLFNLQRNILGKYVLLVDDQIFKRICILIHNRIRFAFVSGDEFWFYGTWINNPTFNQ